MRYEAEDTLALIIDYQEKLVPAMQNKEEFINNSTILIEGLKILGVPMIITQQYTKGLGSTIKEIAAAATVQNYRECMLSGENIPEVKQLLGDIDNEEVQTNGNTGNELYVYDKIAFSCAEDEQIMSIIEDSGANNIILCGCEAHICVLQTLIDLKSKGYNCILVSDCIASRKDMDYNMALVRAKGEHANITTYETILFELLRRGGTEKFKKISKLIK